MSAQYQPGVIKGSGDRAENKKDLVLGCVILRGRERGIKYMFANIGSATLGLSVAKAEESKLGACLDGRPNPAGEEKGAECLGRGGRGGGGRSVKRPQRI